MDLTKPTECNSGEQEAFREFVKSLADENIKEKLGNTSKNCLKTIERKTSLNLKGLEKLKEIYPQEIDLESIKKSHYALGKLQANMKRVKRINQATKVMKEGATRKTAATKIQAALRDKQSRKAITEEKKKTDELRKMSEIELPTTVDQAATLLRVKNDANNIQVNTAYGELRQKYNPANYKTDETNKKYAEKILENLNAAKDIMKQEIMRKMRGVSGGKRKSKKRHYKHIVKTKTIRKKNVKRRRTKKRDKINRRRSRK